MSISREKKTSTIVDEDLSVDEPFGTLEPVAYFNGAIPTGVTISQKGRIFIYFPKWGDEVLFTVGEIGNGGEEAAAAYPDQTMNQTEPNDLGASSGVGSIGCRRSVRPSVDS